MRAYKIAILASGSGSNAENIANYFQSNDQINVSIILSNNKDAKVHERAARLGIPSATFSREDFYETAAVTKQLVDAEIDLVVLAGFLWLVPENLIAAFPDRIVNIHPALLPKYGGKGMYGDRVHEAVVEAREKESGITIHLVNEKYDEGEHLFQATCRVTESDTPDDVAQKVHELEYAHFPRVIEHVLLGDDED